MNLTRQEVEKISLLARLELSEPELATMTEQLGAIVQYVELLGELDTDRVLPMAHAVEITNVFRDDQIRPSTPREEILANAPRHDDEFYHVPAVLGD